MATRRRTRPAPRGRRLPRSVEAAEECKDSRIDIPDECETCFRSGDVLSGDRFAAFVCAKGRTRFASHSDPWSRSAASRRALAANAALASTRRRAAFAVVLLQLIRSGHASGAGAVDQTAQIGAPSSPEGATLPGSCGVAASVHGAHGCLRGIPLVRLGARGQTNAIVRTAVRRPACNRSRGPHLGRQVEYGAYAVVRTTGAIQMSPMHWRDLRRAGARKDSSGTRRSGT